MSIDFKINGKFYKVSLQNYPVDITLNTFIRQHAKLSGTKFMCLEGGCGACICVIKGRHPDTKEMKMWATNSCLTLLNTCDGWEVTTVEGIGNKKDGYHPIQTRLAHLNGTQCGYCSPGMVMNMYGLLESSGGKVYTDEIENSFGGNICRCTGYRPILDAMKSFGADSTYCSDIEDLKKICYKTGDQCSKICSRPNKKVHVIFDDNVEWVKAYSVDDILEVLDKIGSKSYMLVAGNTAHGVYRRSRDIQVFIDVNHIPELHAHHIDKDELVLGGNLSLTETMDILRKASSKPAFEFCKKVWHHMDLIANVPVRNMGTLAGNLSIKHGRNEFPSDIFIFLEALDAKIVVMGTNSKLSKVSVMDYLQMDMQKKVIIKLILPARPVTEYIFNSYKIMPRAQNAHAYVNAGFLMQMSGDTVKSARVCFGGINPRVYACRRH
ncbi:unnamed protein product [Hermetia illucens]|uniref:FAD-binding PCMH-type domain-containing protein n=1 Tax=Hermetia illucens TaxID=343691 RepID=A0A7R8UD64_HERIL|nr:unnamed protein product [Hermetia illucens]